jgi:hypothetical protein
MMPPVSPLGRGCRRPRPKALPRRRSPAALGGRARARRDALKGGLMLYLKYCVLVSEESKFRQKIIFSCSKTI